ncbi:TatD family hydrolase [uncultured Porphyromonas sp.]|uniref:TatD family hydrolase n=1 Tax=uncultured Porphyromonas sp. TaxID=159274 RepID=UPI002625743E|nr:TatD family hydrolase [uncultured Porphyromonas sp.]
MSNERHHSHRELLDCHTHSHEVNGLAIRSLTYEEWSGGVTIQEGQLYSIGLHPWSLPLAERLSDLIDQMRSLLASTPQIVAVGECGIDKVRSNASLAEQRTWLEAQMRLACQFHRPILLHTVRAWSETIEIRRELAQEFDQLPPMVLHGFRARGEVAQMMLHQGFALSFGRHYDLAALQLAYEANALLVETDELPQGLTHREALAEIYTHLATALAITPEALAERVTATPFWQQVERLGSLR